MPLLLDNYREDLQKQKDGSPCYLDEGTFFIKRSGTPEVKKQLAEIRERLYGIFLKDSNGIDEYRIWAHWLAEFGVVGWDDIQHIDENGKAVPLEFTREAARDIFLNEQYRRSLIPKLVEFSLNYENYLCEQSQEDVEQVKKP